MENFSQTCAALFYAAYCNALGASDPDWTELCSSQADEVRAFVAATDQLLQFVAKRVNLSEQEIADISRSYAKHILEGDESEDNVTGQKIEDHEDAAQGIQDDFRAGFGECLSRVLGQLGAPSAPDEGAAPSAN